MLWIQRKEELCPIEGTRGYLAFGVRASKTSKDLIIKVGREEFIFGSTRICTQGLVLARQTLYHLNHTSAHYTLVVFQIRSCTFALGWLQTTFFLPASTKLG
jgi:hypothetical protein